MAGLNASNSENGGGFLKLSRGRIYTLREIPDGWGLRIENNANFTAEISGAFEVGAAAVEPTFIDKLIIIETDDDFSGTSGIERTVTFLEFSRTIDTDAREVVVPAENITLHRVAEPLR